MEEKERKIFEEERFDAYLNKVIIMSSKEYFRKEALHNTRESKIIDDENFLEFINEKTKKEEEFNIVAEDFIEECDNPRLCDAIKQLSEIEQAVVFFIYDKELSREEVALKLDICVDTVSRVKLRAVKKIEKYMKG